MGSDSYFPKTIFKYNITKSTMLCNFLQLFMSNFNTSSPKSQTFEAALLNIKE